MTLLKTLLAGTAFALALCQPAGAAPVTEGGGIVWSRECDGLMLKIPAGWALDNEVARAKGIDMLFYPIEAPANRERLYAWVLPTVKSRADPSISVDALLADSISQARKADHAATQRVLGRTAAAPGRLATTLAYLSLPTRKFHEKIAYVEDEQSIFAIVLTAGSPELLAANEPVLDALLQGARIVHLSSEPPCRLPAPR